MRLALASLGVRVMLGLVLLLSGCSTDDWCARLNLDCSVSTSSDRPAAVDKDGDVWIDVAAGGDDCDDTRAEVNPGEVESCDFLDNNCDGQIDEGVFTPGYVDADGDGYGSDALDMVPLCSSPPVGISLIAGDCDDSRADISPDYPELCDDLDNNCDGQIDEGTDTSFYVDGDGDGYGDPAKEQVYCFSEGPSGYVSNDGDCDDSVPSTSPASSEQCGDAVDNDCDAEVDELDCVAPGSFLYGTLSYSYTGRTVSTGDLNGDGVGDVVVGSPAGSYAQSADGGVFVFYGPISADAFITDSDARVVGSEPSAQAGTGLAVIGDVDGDGLDDVVLSAPYASKQGGEAYLFLGPVSGALEADGADVIYTGDVGESTYQGYTVSAVGDLSGDGVPDVGLLELNASIPGSVRLFSGDASGSVVGADERFATLSLGSERASGRPQVSAADWNGDGLGDLLIGDAVADGYQGAVFGLLGPLSGSTAVASASAFQISGEQFYQIGNAVAAGDLDGDGYTDLLLGAPSVSDGASYVGAAHAVLGPVTGAVSLSSVVSVTLYGKNSSDQVGTGVAVEPDGTLLVAASRVDGSTSADSGVFVLSLPEPGVYLAASASERTLSVANEYGYAAILTSGADLDGDGALDVVLGIPEYSADSYYAGAARIFRAP